MPAAWRIAMPGGNSDVALFRISPFRLPRLACVAACVWLIGGEPAWAGAPRSGGVSVATTEATAGADSKLGTGRVEQTPNTAENPAVNVERKPFAADFSAQVAMTQALLVEQRRMEALMTGHVAQNSLPGQSDIHDRFQQVYGLAIEAPAYDQLLNDIRSQIGEETYSRLLWTYFDIKALDVSINARLAEYDQALRQWMQDTQQRWGLDQRFAFLGVSELENRMEVSTDLGPVPILSPTHAGGKAVLDIRQNPNGVAEGGINEDGFVARLIKLFTIKNFVLLSLVVFSLGLLFRGFRFLVRQRNA
ncbi:hypothetical protein A1355_15360 [Methylomonas koyamae]|uniref:Uncharacterized protein n=1 Tax=Methylomonas koyamae TaxID=702114 RepID=A0A177N407_9GAMM|nr:hypothetical protein A1355_15360 [Methylomonas koyamae]